MYLVSDLYVSAVYVNIVLYLLWQTVPMPVASALRPRFSSGGGRVSGGGDPQTGVSRWKLVKPEEEVGARNKSMAFARFRFVCPCGNFGDMDILICGDLDFLVMWRFGDSVILGFGGLEIW